MDWYYRSSGNQLGPLAESEFAELAADGRIYGDTLVWHDGLDGWKQYQQLRDDQRPVKTANCEHCQGLFATTRLLTITDRQVCYRCKPYYVQQIKEIGFVRKRTATPIMTRFWAAVVDALLITVLMIATMAVGTFLIGILGIGASGTVAGVVAVLGTMFVCLEPVLYMTILVGWKQGTPGKRMCSLKVVMSDGSRVSYKRAFMRSLGATLSPVLLFIPWLVAAFDDQGLAMHDRLCNTKVVKG